MTDIPQLESPYGRLVGRRILEVSEDRQALRVEYDLDERFTNRIGTVAGAAIAGALDSVTGLAANLDLEDGVVAVHKSLSVEYLRPLAAGKILARGRILERADRVVRTRGEILDESGTCHARGEAELRIVVRRSPPGAES